MEEILLSSAPAPAAGGKTIFGFMDFLVNLFDGGIVVVGGGLALIGVVGVGLGLLDIYNHFKPENRDNPGEKNRFVSGAVKFAIGGLLASSGYQVLAENTFKDGATSETITTSIVEEQPAIAAIDPLQAFADQHGLVVTV
ncbi:hypothetical protein VRRI112168_00405 [Vreelandella rituensis]|uniref:Uncharacterized protein n=1 Tax=Vreelandella rituensis TaxID=2282306 RepID=A0A368UBQ7_9GAMM|nr:hypothetical protein [Halomonas rituensis]RCV93842.1 hypothetical protein DU506_01405 [Halomonas rituensis]